MQNTHVLAYCLFWYVIVVCVQKIVNPIGNRKNYLVPQYFLQIFYSCKGNLTCVLTRTFDCGKKKEIGQKQDEGGHWQSTNGKSGKRHCQTKPQENSGVEEGHPSQ